MDWTRRAYLAATGGVVAGTTGLAGCLGGSPAANTSHQCELTERNAVDELPRPRVGEADAEVTVAVFEDFACPHCANFATGALVQLKNELRTDPDVAFERYDFPLPVNEWSNRVANAARSIQESHGTETFFEFAELAYENQADYSWELLGDLAVDVAANPCRVLADSQYRVYNGVIEADRTEGEDRGVEATPSVFVNGELTQATYSGVLNAINGSR